MGISESAIIDKLLEYALGLKELEPTKERSIAIIKLKEAILWLREGRDHE